MEHTMKCDYCKIHYEESEGVCPNCGMTPRKRSIKILYAVAEVIFWMGWIFIIPYACLEAKIGHPRRDAYPECLTDYRWFDR